MASITTQYEVDYPESDGRPMGETDVHRRWMIRIFDLLSHRYRQQDVYLASDLLLYYEHGQPYRFIVPDVFVVFGVTRHDRRRQPRHPTRTPSWPGCRRPRPWWGPA